MRGRKPKPTNLKLLEGNPGKRPLNQNEPKPAPIAPKCPSFLSKSAKAEWRRIAPQLERLGLLTGVDMANLAGYCRAWSELVDAESFLQKHGQTYQIPKRDEEGQVVGLYVQQWPQVTIARKAQEEIRAYSSLFGLSPSDRGRMTVPGAAEEEDPMERLLRKKSGGLNVRPGKSG